MWEIYHGREISKHGKYSYLLLYKSALKKGRISLIKRLQMATYFIVLYCCTQCCYRKKNISLKLITVVHKNTVNFDSYNILLYIQTLY